MKPIFDRLPLMAKVALAPALVLLCLLIVALYSMWTSRATSHTLDLLTQQSFVRVTMVAEAQERAVATNAMVMQSVAYAGAGLKPDVIKALDQKIGTELKATQQRFDRLREVFAGDAEATTRLTRLDAAFKKYTKAALDTLDMKDADLSTAAVMMSTAETAYGETRGLLGEIFNHEVKDAASSGEHARSSLATGNTASVTLAAIALVIGMLVTWFIARQIVQPLQAAVEIAREVADGNLSLREVQAGRDETGQVLRALGEVAQRLGWGFEVASEAPAAVLSAPMLAIKMSRLNQMVSGPLSRLLRGLGRGGQGGRRRGDVGGFRIGRRRVGRTRRGGRGRLRHRQGGNEHHAHQQSGLLHPRSSICGPGLIPGPSWRRR